MKRGVIVGMFAALSVAAVAMLGVLTFFTATDHLNAAREAAQVDKSELKAQVTAGVQRILDNDDTMKDYHIHFLGDLSLFQVTKGRLGVSRPGDGENPAGHRGSRRGDGLRGQGHPHV